ncbi:MAG: EI24 domain-containing protein [Campylobacterales bacterium]|nr:EI24 domain-containing protein [Campylobacterota bacterium]MBD3843903.1 EI24 domain-containing protein [Campylobacterales bacterium]
MVTILLRTFGDILSFKVFFFVLKITFFSLLASTAIMWGFWDIISALISGYLEFIPWDWLQISSQTLIKILFGYILFISFLSMGTSIWSDDVIKEISLQHYPNIKPDGKPDILKVIFINLKATAIFLTLFVLCLPLIFIPIIGQIIMLYLWSIQVKVPTAYDVGVLFHQPDVRSSRTISLIASLFNYIPVLNIFAPLFAAILFLHDFMDKQK